MTATSPARGPTPSASEESSGLLRSFVSARANTKSAPAKNKSIEAAPRMPVVERSVETHENPWLKRIPQKIVWFTCGSLYFIQLSPNVPGPAPRSDCFAPSLRTDPPIFHVVLNAGETSAGRSSCLTVGWNMYMKIETTRRIIANKYRQSRPRTRVAPTSCTPRRETPTFRNVSPNKKIETHKSTIQAYRYLM